MTTRLPNGGSLDHLFLERDGVLRDLQIPIEDSRHFNLENNDLICGHSVKFGTFCWDVVNISNRFVYVSLVIFSKPAYREPLR